MFEINGTQWCPYCQKAKELLDSLSMEFEFVDLDEFPEKGISLVGKGFKTIPQIYFNGKHVGGYEELKQFLAEG